MSHPSDDVLHIHDEEEDMYDLEKLVVTSSTPPASRRQNRQESKSFRFTSGSLPRSNIPARELS